MPEPLTAYNIEIWTTLNELKALILTWKNGFTSLATAINSGNPASVSAACAQLHDQCILWSVKLCDSSGFKGKLHQSLHWIDDEWSTGNGDVTMDAILTAMLAAEFDEIQQLVGIVDAYRVALWDTWFNTEFYAALARGFKQLRP